MEPSVGPERCPPERCRQLYPELCAPRPPGQVVDNAKRIDEILNIVDSDFASVPPAGQPVDYAQRIDAIMNKVDSDFARINFARLNNGGVLSAGPEPKLVRKNPPSVLALPSAVPPPVSPNSERGPLGLFSEPSARPEQPSTVSTVPFIFVTVVLILLFFYGQKKYRKKRSTRQSRKSRKYAQRSRKSRNKKR